MDDPNRGIIRQGEERGRMWRRIGIVACAVMWCSVASLGDANKASRITAAPQAKNEIENTLAKVRIGPTLDSRVDAAEHLERLILSVRPSDVDDKTFADIVALLDDPEDAVRFWVAASLGHLGQRAKPAVPKLLKALTLSDCMMVDLSSAPAIRVALTRIGEKEPPKQCLNEPNRSAPTGTKKVR